MIGIFALIVALFSLVIVSLFVIEIKRENKLLKSQIKNSVNSYKWFTSHIWDCINDEVLSEDDKVKSIRDFTEEQMHTCTIPINVLGICGIDIDFKEEL